MVSECVRRTKAVNPARGAPIVAWWIHGCITLCLMFFCVAQMANAQGIVQCNKNNKKTCKRIHIEESSEPPRSLMNANGNAVVVNSHLPSSATPNTLKVVNTLRFKEMASLIEDMSKPKVLMMWRGSCVPENKYPWMVALFVRGADQGKGYFCGGSILDKRWVVTANHCVIGKNKNQVTVYAGSVSLSSPVPPAQRVGVAEIISNDGSFNSMTLDNDIALLKLESDLNFSDSTGAIGLLPASKEEIYAIPGTLATVMGWGVTKMGVTEGISDQLREVHEPIHTIEDCRVSYKETEETLTDNMICAGYEDGRKGHCVKDSGGPLVVPTSRGWTAASFGSAPNGWYVGDFDGDGTDDILRYCPPDKAVGRARIMEAHRTVGMSAISTATAARTIFSATVPPNIRAET